CPPAFMVPTFQVVSSGRLFQWRTTFEISTSAPSTEIFTSLTSSFIHFPSSAVILMLGSAELIVCSPSTNHSSLALAVPKVPSKTTDARPRAHRTFMDPPVLSDPRPGDRFAPTPSEYIPVGLLQSTASGPSTRTLPGPLFQ